MTLQEPGEEEGVALAVLRSRYNDDGSVTSPRPTGSGAPRRTVPPAVLVTVAATVAVLASGFLPWHRSGLARRDSFELARLADSLGVAETAPARMVLWAWFAVPALVGATWLAAALRRVGLVAVLGGTVAAVAVVAGVVVLAAPGPSEPGPWVALGAGAVAAGGALRTVWRGRRRR